MKSSELPMPANSNGSEQLMYKPCPFCGHRGPEVIRASDDDDSGLPKGTPRVIACRNPFCGAVAPAHSWNKRVGLAG